MGRVLAGVLICALACAFGGGPATTAQAVESAGPRIAFSEWQVGKPVEKSRFVLASVGPVGEERRTLVPGGGSVGPFVGTGLSWSPDGSELAFAGVEREGSSSREERAIFVIPAAGGTPRRIAGTAGGSHPVWSPNGEQIAFSRQRERSHIEPKKGAFSFYMSRTAWVIAAAGGKPRRLTAWGNGRFATPSSFTLDGRRLALTVQDARHGPEAVLLDLGSGRTSVIAPDAKDPAVSPDGSRVALVSYRDRVVAGEGENRSPVGELYTVDLDGDHPRRLTRTPDRQEAAPSWDPSGTRIAFVQGTVQWAVGLTGVIEAINADGSCPTLVAGKPKEEGRYGPPLDGPGLFTPAWQPGPERGAEPLAC